MTYLNTIHLEVGASLPATIGVDTVLIRDDLPELCSDLVATLASLDVDNFSHVVKIVAAY